MALTIAQYKALIISELVDTADGKLAANIDLLWDKYPGTFDLHYHYLKTKLDAIDMLLGVYRAQVSFRALDGASVDLSDLFKHLMQLRKILIDDIVAIGTFSRTMDRVDGYSILSDEIGT